MKQTKTEQVARAWCEAGKVLGIRVEAPFALKDAEGNTYLFAAFLPDFGGKNGALLLVAEMPSFQHDVKAEACAKERQFWLSILDSDSYSQFDRELFTTTLNDFQYFGSPSAKPSWYTGASWT